MNGVVKDRTEDPVTPAGVPNSAIVEYLSSEKTQSVLRFIVTHLGVSRPDDPVAFLSDLLTRGLESRGRTQDGEDAGQLDESLVLFQTRHIEALLNAMDPFRRGVVSVVQYHNGMCTMGLADYNREPATDEEGFVSRDTFMQEA
ncbi:uncharacterized protein LOC117649536 [Thrips palmi]|uniref:Uncharacterized protein LOC117649536 n=1 Tax=Thrips palmi TaxID=161013 RepID=A0A6P8ZT94_THRPL|nr:uncharacterized protein LOC117649536 [Thrips palmi]